MMAKLLSRLLVLSLLLALVSCNNGQETIRPEYMPLTESVYASGTVKSKDQYQVFATVSGVIEEWFVEEGDTVDVGTPLLKVKSDNTDLNAENALIALNQAKDDLRENAPVLTELKLNIETARLAYVTDSVNYIRKKNLIEQDIGTEADFDQYKLKFETSQRNYEVAKQRLELKREQLKNEVERAENLYKISLNNTGDFTINSKLKGEVYAKYQERGELVKTQQPLALVGSNNTFLVELMIDELDISKVAIGQKVLLTLDSYGDEVFEAKLSKIFPILDERTQTIKAEAYFEKTPEKLYPGLTVEANVITNEKEGALVIPASYLLDGNKVMTQEKEEVTIEVGLKNMEFVEVLSGIDTTTVLIKPGT